MFDKVKDKVRAHGRDLAIEVAVEIYHDVIIEGLRKICEPYTPEIVCEYIDQDKPWPALMEWINKARQFSDVLDRFSSERLFEWLQEARPDLAEAVIGNGEESRAEWWCKNINMVKALIRAPGFDMAKRKESESEAYSRVVCDKCEGVFIIPRDRANDTRVCPYCGEGAK